MDVLLDLTACSLPLQKTLRQRPFVTQASTLPSTPIEDTASSTLTPAHAELRAPLIVALVEHPQCEEPFMTDSDTRNHRIEHPDQHYRTPEDISNDPTLSAEEKKKALDNWEQDAHQLLTASGEGTPGSKEGSAPRDHHHLGEVVRAKGKTGANPKHKPSC
jgi:hypothetical protein